MPDSERDKFPVVVHLMLTRHDQVFLLRRANTGFMDGYFSLPGGHQRFGESVSEATLRECIEETGVRPLDLQARCVLPYISGHHQGLNFIFAAGQFDGEPGIREPELFDACCWATRGELPKKVAPWLGDLLEMPQDSWYREFRWD